MGPRCGPNFEGFVCADCPAGYKIETADGYPKSAVGQAGCPRDRLTLGLPFYGRSLQQPGQVATYEELRRRLAVLQPDGAD